MTKERTETQIHPSIAALDALNKAIKISLENKSGENTNNDGKITLTATQLYNILEPLNGAQTSYFHELVSLTDQLQNGEITNEEVEYILKIDGFGQKNRTDFIKNFGSNHNTP